MRAKYILLLLATMLSSGAIVAQVGIGTNTPDANAILGLTNTGSKGFVLPTTTGVLPAGTPASWMIFNPNDSVIYMHEGNDNFNALTPWKFKFNGAVSNDTYYTQGGNVGIGISNPPTKLTITGGSDAAGATGNNGYVLIGDFSAGHMVIDDNEIIAKSDANTSSTLNLQNDGGSVAIGGSTLASLTVSGNVNTDTRILEDGVALLPAGSIIMWYTGTAPTGWGICNGTLYTKTDGTGSTSTLAAGAGDDPPAGLATNWAGAHTPSGTIGNSGSGTAHENRPPYYALAFIMKL